MQQKRKVRSGSAREMVSVALPMVASLSCDTVMVFSDRWFVSKLGSSAMNAVFVGGLAAFASRTFFTGLIGYSTALVSQQLGAGQPRRCVVAAYQALIVALVAWPLLLLLIPVGNVVFPRLGLPASQITAQLRYFDILMLGAGLGLFRGVFSGFFTGLGRTRIVMLASFVSMLTNLPLVWGLVFGNFGLPALGVTGAAIGTLVASGLGLTVLAWAFFAAPGARSLGPLPRFGIDRLFMSELLRKGTPSGVEFFLNMLAFQTIVVLFQRQGETSATAASIMFAWDMVSFVPLVGVEVGVTSLVGRHKGAGNHAGVRRSLRSGLKLGWAFSALILAAFLAIPGVLVDVFRANSPSATFELARPLAISMIRIASLYVTIEAVLLVYTGALRGVGDTLFAMIASNGMHWLLVVALWITFESLKLSTLTGWMVLVGVLSLFPLAFGLRWRERTLAPHASSYLA
jgi:MATE family multidrug resistance protein